MALERKVVGGRGNVRNASAIVRGGDFLFVSGLTAIDPDTGERVLGTTAGQTEHILAHLRALLESAGSSLDKVVKVNVVLRSMLEASNMNEAYAAYFRDAPPARTVCGASLPEGVNVMIECTALP